MYIVVTFILSIEKISTINAMYFSHQYRYCPRDVFNHKLSERCYVPGQKSTRSNAASIKHVNTTFQVALKSLGAT